MGEISGNVFLYNIYIKNNQAFLILVLLDNYKILYKTCLVFIYKTRTIKSYVFEMIFSYVKLNWMLSWTLVSSVFAQVLKTNKNKNAEGVKYICQSLKLWQEPYDIYHFFKIKYLDKF